MSEPTVFQLQKIDWVDERAEGQRAPEAMIAQAERSGAGHEGWVRDWTLDENVARDLLRGVQRIEPVLIGTRSVAHDVGWEVTHTGSTGRDIEVPIEQLNLALEARRRGNVVSIEAR